MIGKCIDQMTIEELLDAAGNPNMTMHTYLYVDNDGRVCAMEKTDRETRPADEVHGLGYAFRYMHASAGTGRPWWA